MLQNWNTQKVSKVILKLNYDNHVNSNKNFDIAIFQKSD